jgi:response regulator NasT
LERTAKNTDEGSLERLRILVADGRGEVLDEVARTVAGLGHEVVGEADLSGVAALTASLRPDAAIVIVGESSEHALDLIGRIVTEASCPVIAILDVEDEAFIREAARRGIFAYITMGREAAALQSSLDVVLSRFAEYHGLEGAFARRAITERAKGILMERHAIDEKQAFTMLREEARRTNRKITDVAEAVALSVTLLPARPSLSPTLHVEDDAVLEVNEAPGPSPRAWSEER